MNLLLDTHALIWFLEDDPKLSLTARAAIGDARNRSYVSDATAWEVCIKVSLGKLKTPVPFAELFPARLESLSFQVLPIRHVHLHGLLQLPFHHRDPFDRLLIAQSHVEGLTLVSGDPQFRDYGVPLLW
ncbi:MAG: type II toxin-antitoxin system VapC family toxin [Verrucomicrobia bacterium]|nr:type II toxin-antitoxin system VapC family toxin [Verrucomicrobiota bacterium]